MPPPHAISRRVGRQLECSERPWRDAGGDPGQKGAAAASGPRQPQQLSGLRARRDQGAHLRGGAQRHRRRAMARLPAAMADAAFRGICIYVQVGVGSSLLGEIAEIVEIAELGFVVG